jgi:threonine/homoserine/homoserine lactone efflux protein
MTMPADDDDKRANWERREAVRDNLKEEWDILYKAPTTLMVANAAGLVTCLTFLKDFKDYNTTPQLKDVGIFVWMFGIGLLLASGATLFMIWLRPRYLSGLSKQWLKRVFGILLVLSGLSGLCVAAAVTFAIYKFGPL